MKKIIPVLLLGAFLLSGCVTTGSDNPPTVETQKPGGNMLNPERIEDTKQTKKVDVSGIYTDKQGTDDVYSELILVLQADGTYAVEISIFRTIKLKGTAVRDGETLRFASKTPYPYVLANISVTGSKAQVTVITDTSGLLVENVYYFPDGAPGKKPE